MPEDKSPHDSRLSPPLPFGKRGAATPERKEPIAPSLTAALRGEPEASAAIAGPAGTQAEMTLAPHDASKPLSEDAATVSLDDVYTKSEGMVFLNGIQALVRLPIVQVARDRAAGLNTAGFVTGYRGSPLGGYDIALAKAKRHLDNAGVVVMPAVNEELAATALQGTQELGLSPGRRHDGVFGIWYGKGPGADRTGDAFKHGNAMGSAANGGVLCIVGDDHGAKSSTIPHQSEHTFAAATIPILYPSSVHEFVRFGLLGIAMSRYSGCWVAMKTIADTVESTATVDVTGDLEFDIKTPSEAEFAIPEGGLNYRWPDDRWTQDHRLQNYKAYAALAFARANKIDRIVLNPARAQYGIAASGKSYEETREALSWLGIDDAMAERIGLRLYKIGMPWPLEPHGVREFAQGLTEILVVEERREMVENQVKQALFNVPTETRARIVGKFDENDKPVFPLDAEMPAEGIAEILVSRLLKLDLPHDIRRHLVDAIEVWHRRRKLLDKYLPPTLRTPHFCPGCPHNTSTVVPKGSRASAGIGCHFMANWMDRNTETFTQMGGEGANWMGVAPFTDEKHIFANLGDGTYFHSGILAVRQAVASKANITYKILFNDAVAMTGGQAVDGPLSVPQLTHQLRAEGVGQIYVLSAHPEIYKQSDFAAGTVLKERDAIVRVQEALREIPGCTAMVYDQTCATELRRKRVRGQRPMPTERPLINSAVCEGCGDCSTQSNCIAIEPLETEMGRKRAIDQNACNVDLSCLKGFCPSFVTVKGAALRKGAGLELPRLTLPEPRLPALPAGIAAYNVAVAGVGGTGVLTVGRVVGMAASLDGVGSLVQDVSGLAQKGGAVISHIRLGQRSENIAAPHIPLGHADLLLAADRVVGSSREALTLVSPQRSLAIVDAHNTPVANFIFNRDFDFRQKDSMGEIEASTRGVMAFDFHRLAVKALGDEIASNLMMVGYAFQQGLLPISAASLKRAIELNNVAVPFNLAAFEWGRYAAAFPDKIAALLESEKPPRTLDDMSLDQLIGHRGDHLTLYQGRKLAARYRKLVDKVRQRERNIGGSEELARAVAVNYAKVLAYKDEYEVARLFLHPDFKKQLRETFEGSPDVTFHLAPPLLAKFDKNLGRPRKMKFGSYLWRVFRLLAAFKFLRATPLDPFRWSKERKRERALIRTYERGIDQVLVKLNAENYRAALAVAQAPDAVRGFGPVKLGALDKFEREWPVLLARLDAPAPPAATPKRELEPAE
ncbi:MAG TPA: indolepyruvate ferredoxin oxidoreductase family protein [Stellaceae bacterium]